MVDHPMQDRFSDPVPEELRPTPRRLAFWTLIVGLLAVAAGGSFVVEQMLTARPHVAANSPQVKSAADTPG